MISEFEKKRILNKIIRLSESTGNLNLKSVRLEYKNILAEMAKNPLETSKKPENCHKDL